MRDLIAELPQQLRWAAALDVPDVADAREAVVTGMGGSGMAGDIAALVAESQGRRVVVHKGYDMPGWVGADQLVVAVSHSGNTEETSSALTRALDLGATTVAVATGGEMAGRAGSEGVPFVPVPPGPQPRAAVGYLSGAVLRVLEAAGVVESQVEGLEEAADVVTSLLEGAGPALAADLADALRDRVAVVYGGGGPTSVAAGRWKTQINENAKAPAYVATLPEADHNEIVGWTTYPDISADAVGVVFLRDRDGDPRVERRVDLTRELMEDGVGIAGEVYASGDGILARVFSLVVIGDLVSVAIAEQAGVDPMPVDVIERLKLRLKDDT